MLKWKHDSWTEGRWITVPMKKKSNTDTWKYLGLKTNNKGSAAPTISMINEKISEQIEFLRARKVSKDGIRWSVN